MCKLIFADRYHTVSFSSPYKFAKLFGFIDACNYSTGIKTIKNRIARFFFRNLEEWLYGRYIARNLSDTHFDTAVIYSSKVAGLTLRSVTADNYISFYITATSEEFTMIISDMMPAATFLLSVKIWQID